MNWRKDMEELEQSPQTREELCLLRQTVEESQVLILRAEVLKMGAEELLEGKLNSEADVQNKLQACVEEADNIETSAYEAGIRAARVMKMMINVERQRQKKEEEEKEQYDSSN